MKYFTYLSKQILSPKNNEITSSIKIEDMYNRNENNTIKTDISTKLLLQFPKPIEDISDHISYLHKKHTEDFIHEKEIEEGIFIWCISCPKKTWNWCYYIYNKLLLFPKY